jgi:hypothetical protein
MGVVGVAEGGYGELAWGVGMGSWVDHDCAGKMLRVGLGCVGEGSRR